MFIKLHYIPSLFTTQPVAEKAGLEGLGIQERVSGRNNECKEKSNKKREVN